MPTTKQKIAASKTLENGGVVSKAMLDAGYSPAMAKNPQKLTESKGWQELMDKYLPDERIMQKISDGLDATRIHTSHTEPDKVVPDWNIQHKFTETSLKIKGRGVPEEGAVGVVNMVVFNINESSKTQHNGSHKPSTETTEGSRDAI